MAKDSYIECGRIVNTHGVKGMLKVESWCDSPEVLVSFDRLYIKKEEVYCEFGVINSQIHKNLVLVQLDKINSLDEAMLYKGATVYADREDFDLDEGDYFIADIIGARVVDADNNRCYGTLKDVFSTAASEIYVVATENGDRMIPAVDEFIISVDVEKSIVTVRPIEGMFD